MKNPVLDTIREGMSSGKKFLAVLVDPEKFSSETAAEFFSKIPKETSHLFVGGSADNDLRIEEVVKILKKHSALPVVLFPGDYSQLTKKADAVLFLSLLSGRNPEYLIGQQVKGAEILKTMSIEVIPTAYLLIDGGNFSSVARVTNTSPMDQTDIRAIVNTALAGQFMGAKMIYLEAGSGAKNPISAEIISAVKQAVAVPLIVGGGIRTEAQRELSWKWGADMVVMGTVFETKHQL